MNIQLQAFYAGYMNKDANSTTESPTVDTPVAKVDPVDPSAEKGMAISTNSTPTGFGKVLKQNKSISVPENKTSGNT